MAWSSSNITSSVFSGLRGWVPVLTAVIFGISVGCNNLCGVQVTSSAAVGQLVVSKQVLGCQPSVLCAVVFWRLGSLLQEENFQCVWSWAAIFNMVVPVTPSAANVS